MPDPSSVFLGLEKVVNWLWALVLAAFAWGWKHTHTRIDTLQTEIGVLSVSKADKSELDRQRDVITRIFERLDEQGRMLAAIDAKLTIVCKLYQDHGR